MCIGIVTLYRSCSCAYVRAANNIPECHAANVSFDTGDYYVPPNFIACENFRMYRNFEVEESHLTRTCTPEDYPGWLVIPETAFQEAWGRTLLLPQLMRIENRRYTMIMESDPPRSF